MIIENSQLTLSGEHHKAEVRQQHIRVEAFMVEFDAARARHGRELVQVTGRPAPEPLSREPDAWQLRSTAGPDLRSASASLDGAARLFHALLEALTGRREIRLQPVESPVPSQSEADPAPASRLRALKVELRLHQRVEEYEQSRFKAAGVVETRDGERLDLDLTLTMSRSYRAETRVVLDQALQFKDPLVVNFDGTAAELTDENYGFDLDGDGEQEVISCLGGSSAYLALDRNGDGTVNDGTELFGALSGDGFADLARYDEDGNGWIDEADSVFADLRLWRQFSEQPATLESLTERQIGALYLGATQTPFELKGEDNRTLGQVRQSGIYLSEDGAVGTLQQIDLAV